MIYQLVTVYMEKKLAYEDLRHIWIKHYYLQIILYMMKKDFGKKWEERPGEQLR